MTNIENTPLSFDDGQFDDQASAEAEGAIVTGAIGDQRILDKQAEVSMAESTVDTSNKYVDSHYDEDASKLAELNVGISTHASIEVFEDALQRKAERDLASTALENTSANEPVHPVAS